MYLPKHAIFAQKVIRMHLVPDFEPSLVLTLFYLFGALVVLQLLYTFLFYGRLAFYRHRKIQRTDDLVPVSIIIAARNESDNLYANLPTILSQDYPQFEVIVVNNQSLDDSYHVLNAYKLQYPNLRVVEMERSTHLGVGKKLPLTLGIKSAKYDHFLLTDADCVPNSKQWLRKMASRFVPGKEIVLGYGPYKTEKGLLNRIIRFDTSFVAMNYLSFALARLPYMAVGRNLAYTRSVFESVKGFKSHYAIRSGDDDLFVQEAAKKRNYVVEIDPDTHCYSEGKKTWKDWFQQKSRHYSTSERYQVIKKALLGIYPLTLVLAWISFVILMFNSEYRWLTLAVFVGMIVLKWWIQGRCFIKLKASSLVWSLPVFDLLYAILMPVLYYSTDKAPQGKWR